MLTTKQKECLNLINSRIERDGVPPSYVEMMADLGLASKSGVHRLVTALERRGFIERIPSNARAIKVLRLPSDIPVAEGPLSFDARVKAICADLGDLANYVANRADGLENTGWQSREWRFRQRRLREIETIFRRLADRKAA